MLRGNIHTSGEFGSEKYSLRQPAGLDVASNGSIVIADQGSGTLGILRYFGSEIKFIVKGILKSPVDVAVLTEDRFAVANKNGVIILNRAGIQLAFAGYGTDRRMLPQSVAYSDGKLYISDSHSFSVLVYTMGKK